jgi:hypothetical protein
MTLDLEVNEVEVEGLTSLASVTEATAHTAGNEIGKISSPRTFSTKVITYDIMIFRSYELL